MSNFFLVDLASLATGRRNGCFWAQARLRYELSRRPQACTMGGPMKARRQVAAALAAALLAMAASALAAVPRTTQNVLWIMTDGLRWQEVFSGAEEVLMTKENGDVKDVLGLRLKYWRDTPEARRE